MLKTVLITLLALLIAIPGGAASVWYALQSGETFGAVAVDGWTAFPDLGTDAADPYSDARVALEGVLALGSAEGLSFVAQRDSQGAALRRECSYLVDGSFPSARFWTLYAAEPSLALLDSGRRRRAATHSYEVIRKADNVVAVSVSAEAQPGNWLPSAGTGPMSLVLTLYDTPLASSTGLSQVTMPKVTRTVCGA